MSKINYKEIAEECPQLMDEEFLRGAETLYHHLQDTIIGHSGTDAVSTEVLKFLNPLRKKIFESKNAEKINSLQDKNQNSVVLSDGREDITFENEDNKTADKSQQSETETLVVNDRIKSADFSNSKICECGHEKAYHEITNRCMICLCKKFKPKKEKGNEKM